MPRKNTKVVQEKKTRTKVGERGKKKQHQNTGETPAATTEAEFLEALRKEFFSCLAEQDVTRIKGMIDREFKARRRLEKVKNKRFDPFTVFKQSGLGSIPFDLVTTQAPFPERRAGGGGGRQNKQMQGHSPQQAAPIPPQRIAIPSTPGACDYTPLHLAVIQCDLQAVKQLTKDLRAQHLVIDKRFQTPLYLALQTGNRDLIRYMAECRASPNALKDLQCGNPNFIENWNETFVAAFYGNTSVFIDSMAEPLLFSPHLVDKCGRTLFHVLAMHEETPHLQMLRLLARKCPDENKSHIEELEPVELEPTNTEEEKRTEKEKEREKWEEQYYDVTFHVDTEEGEGEEELKKTGEENVSNDVPKRKIHINWNAGSFKGGLPLHVAAYEQNYIMTEYILKEGGAVNRPNPYDGRTALHYAVESNTPRIAALLLDYSADKQSIDSDGRTPLQLAEYLHFDQVKEVLEHHVPVPPVTPARRGGGPSRSSSASKVKEEEAKAINQAEEEEASSLLIGLPTQLLVHIAEFLSLDEILELGHVCRRLRHIAKAEVLWNDINLNSYSCRFPSAERFKKFTYYHLYKAEYLNVCKLNLHPKFLLQEILFGNGKLAQKLEGLKIDTRPKGDKNEESASSWTFDVKYINQLLDCCPRLTSLQCTSFYPDSDDGEHVDLKGDALRRLKRFHFELDKDSKKLPDFLSNFDGGCLEDLHIGFNTRIARSNEALLALSSTSLKESLINLEVQSKIILSDSALQSLASFHKLKVLVLRLKRISADTILQILNGAGQHLETLHIALESPPEKPEATKEGIMTAILHALPSLTSLSLSCGIIEESELVNAFLHTPVSIRYLTLINFSSLSDNHIEALAKTPLSCQLKSLNVRGAPELTRNSISVLLGTHFTQLEYLGVRDCPQSKLQEDDLEKVLLSSPRGASLRRLELEVDSSLQSNQFTTLLMGCPLLAHLSLRGASVTDDWFRPSFFCPDLKVLIFEGDAKGFGDYSLSRLAHSCPNLRRLEILSPTNNLSRASVHHVLRHFPHLQKLRVAGSVVLYSSHLRISSNPTKRRLFLL